MQQFRQLPTSLQTAAWILLGLTAFLIWDQYHWWQLKDEYAFGYIVPMFVGFIVYDRWPQFSAVWLGTAEDSEKTPLQPVLRRLFGFVAGLMVLGGLACFVIGALYRAMEGNNLITSNFLAFGYANIVLGGVYLYSDEDKDGNPIPFRTRLGVTLLFLFPAVIWMLSVPMFSVVHRSISTFLMNKVAVVVYESFDLLGFAITREGSVLKLPLGDVGVEDACSGIRSLTACLFAGSFLGAAFFAQFWKKVFLVGTAMVLAFINNIFRSLFLTGWAYAKGPEGLDQHVELWGMDLGNIHDFTGWVVLGFTVVGLLILVKIFSIELEYQVEETPTKQADSAPS